LKTSRIRTGKFWLSARHQNLGSPDVPSTTTPVNIHLQAQIYLLGFTRLTTDPLFLQFYYLLLLKLLHVSVVRPSSSRNIFARIYSPDNGSVVFRI
jgi:hypothetical protein